MQFSRSLNPTIIALSIALGTVPFFSEIPLQAQETQTVDRPASFTQPPRLLTIESSEKQVAASRSTYFFTLNMPENAGSGLGQITINQRDADNFLRQIDYRSEDTRAFTGTAGDRGTDIPIADTTYNEDDHTLTVRFAEPVAPGTSVTIALRPRRNPRMQGVYLFGVTAFPANNTENGQFLGYGRLTFYGNDSPAFPGM
jgi:hypothetical protein